VTIHCIQLQNTFTAIKSKHLVYEATWQKLSRLAGSFMRLQSLNNSKQQRCKICRQEILNIFWNALIEVQTVQDFALSKQVWKNCILISERCWGQKESRSASNSKLIQNHWPSKTHCNLCPCLLKLCPRYEKSQASHNCHLFIGCVSRGGNIWVRTWYHKARRLEWIWSVLGGNV